MNKSRLKQLQKTIRQPMLIKKKENLLYLTGQKFDYRAEEYLLVKKNGAVGFGSGLEKISWAKRSDRFKNIGKYIHQSQTLELFPEFTYGEVAYIRSKNKELRIKVRIEHSPVDYQRMVKESREIALVRKSMSVVGRVFKRVKKELTRKQWTEEKLSKFIQETGFKLGADDISFPAIVASGANAAIPHHIPSSKRLKAGESIIIDFGFKYKNYCSDFTRTVFLKRVPSKLERAYNQVEKAYLESISFLSSSGGRSETRGSKKIDTRFRGNDKKITGNDVYQKAVDVLAEKRLDRYFIHSLGHGTGLEIHELPNLSPGSKDILKNGMVFSVEPGVYIPRLGGIRIEDLVYLEKGRVKKFIEAPTKLENNIL